ncbi:MAG: SurA N-terminal domain-containing protein [Bdellovibrionales bacterium]|nr:SurA N-terminal domain-containing protein [Bdellovibrionales bacterium]
MKILLPILFLIPTVFFTLWYQNRIPVESVLAHVNGSFIVVQEVEQIRQVGEPMSSALDRMIDRRLLELEGARAGVSLDVVEGFFDRLDHWNPSPEQERRVQEAERTRFGVTQRLDRDDLVHRMKARAKAQYINSLRSKAVIEKYIP